MDSLRAKQNMEILDVFKDINGQVVGLQKRQIQQFPESLMPKTQRDIGAEVNTDKGIEQVNRTLELKLGALEILVQNFSRGGSGISPDELSAKENKTLTGQVEQTVTNTGDVVPLYNAIVRSSQAQGINRDSQNIIKVKVQDLLPNLDAMNYGIHSAVDYLFENRNLSPAIGLTILELLRTLSVYQMMKQQVESGLLELISSDGLARAYKNVLDDQSTNRLALLKQFAPRGAITSSSIRNIPDFDILDREVRLKQIASELGLESNVLINAQTKNMSGSQFDRFVTQLRNEKGNTTKRIEGQAIAILRSFQQTESSILNKRALGLERADDIVRLRDEIAELEDERMMVIDDETVARETLPIPEEPLVGEEPQRSDFPEGKEGDEAFDIAINGFIKSFINALELRVERETIMNFNQFLREKRTSDRAERATIIGRKRRTMNTRRGSLAVLNREIEQLENQARQLIATGNRLNAGDRETFQRNAGVIRDAFHPSALKPTNLTDATDVLERENARRNPRLPPRRRVVVVDDDDEKLGVGRPHKGEPVDTRGLATLRKNYGYASSSSDSESESESESDEDPLDFDDSRNEMYYTKPLR